MFALKHRVRRDLNTDVSVFRENCRDVGRVPTRKVHTVICHRSGQHYLKSGGPYGPVKDKMYWPGGLKSAPGQCLCRGL